MGIRGEDATLSRLTTESAGRGARLLRRRRRRRSAGAGAGDGDGDGDGALVMPSVNRMRKDFNYRNKKQANEEQKQLPRIRHNPTCGSTMNLVAH